MVARPGGERSRELSSRPRTRPAMRGGAARRRAPLTATVHASGLFRGTAGSRTSGPSRTERVLELLQAFSKIVVRGGPGDPKTARSTKKRSRCHQHATDSGGVLDRGGQVTAAGDGNEPE